MQFIVLCFMHVIVSFCRATFAEFFGTNNPFESFFNNATTPGGTNPGFPDLLDDHDDPFGFVGLGTGLGANLGGFGPSRTPFRSHSFNVGSQNRPKEKPQDPPIEHDLYVTLEDLFKVTIVLFEQLPHIVA